MRAQSGSSVMGPAYVEAIGQPDTLIAWLACDPHGSWCCARWCVLVSAWLPWFDHAGGGGRANAIGGKVGQIAAAAAGVRGRDS